MYSFRVMFRAPDSGGHASGVVAKPNYIYLISPGAFHRLDIKPHSPSRLMRTTNVNCGHVTLETYVKYIRRLRILTALVTRVALNASASSALTNLTDLLPSCYRDGADAFNNFHGLCLREFCLGGPDSTYNMSPVIPRGLLQWFTRVFWSTLIDFLNLTAIFM